MADARITIALDREDRERIDALTRELVKLSALLAGNEPPCPHVVDVLEGVQPNGNTKWGKRCLLLAGQARGEGCGRCGSVGASTTVEHRFNDWRASRRAVVSDEPR